MASLADALMGAVPQLTARKAKLKRTYVRKKPMGVPHGRNQYTGNTPEQEIEKRIAMVVEYVRTLTPHTLVGKSTTQRNLGITIGLLEGLEAAKEQGYLGHIQLGTGASYVRTDKE